MESALLLKNADLTPHISNKTVEQNPQIRTITARFSETQPTEQLVTVENQWLSTHRNGGRWKQYM